MDIKSWGEGIGTVYVPIWRVHLLSSYPGESYPVMTSPHNGKALNFFLLRRGQPHGRSYSQHPITAGPRDWGHLSKREQPKPTINSHSLRGVHITSVLLISRLGIDSQSTSHNKNDHWMPYHIQYCILAQPWAKRSQEHEIENVIWFTQVVPLTEIGRWLASG